MEAKTLRASVVLSEPQRGSGMGRDALWKNHNRGREAQEIGCCDQGRGNGDCGDGQMWTEQAVRW